MARFSNLMSLVSPPRAARVFITGSVSDEDIEDIGPFETSSFVSETSSEIDGDESEPVSQTQSLRSLPSPESARTVSSSGSYYSSDSSDGHVVCARDFMMTQASLDGFVVSDEYSAEEEMNSEDRAFIASSGSSVANDSITMYRLLDRSQRWRPFELVIEEESTSSE